MESYHKYYLLNKSDIGYPRFTTARRQLKKYDELAQDFYRKMCREFDLRQPPPLSVGYMLNKGEFIQQEKTAAGICFYSQYDNNPRVPVEWNVAISYSHAMEYHERTLHETVPHEVCHAIHGMIDLEVYENDAHGKDFMDIFQVGKKIYPLCVPNTSFPLESPAFNKMSEVMQYDLTKFGQL